MSSLNRLRHSYKVQCICHFKGSFRWRVFSPLAAALCRRLIKQFETHRVVRKSSSQSLDIDDLTIVFVGSAESRRLNKTYRRRDYATDVLSFSPMASGEGLGELILCVPVLKRQAAQRRHSFKKELDMMLIHGFLHLLGFDHEKNRKEELKMMGLQDKLFKEITQKQRK